MEMFDVVVYLEVAEHIPYGNVVTFVDMLASLSPWCFFLLPYPIKLSYSLWNLRYPLQRCSKQLTRNTVSAILKETSCVSGGNRIERFAYSFHQRFPTPSLRLTQKAFNLRESLPTFICVVQVHILDDAQEGAEDGLRRLAYYRNGSRGIAPRPLWRS